MHLETAGEAPPTQVLQIHKSMASAKSIKAIFYVALVLLLYQLICLTYCLLIYSGYM